MAQPTCVPLQVDSDLAANWLIFASEFRSYIKNINEKVTPETPVAILLNVIGQDGLKIFNKLQLSESEVNDINTVLSALETYCLSPNAPDSKTNINAIHLKYISDFEQRMQQSNENFEDFLMDLYTLAKNCSFDEQQKDKMILKQIMHGIDDTSTKEQLNKMLDPNLINGIALCRVAERLKYQSNDEINNAVVANSPANRQFSNSSTECVLQDVNATDNVKVIIIFYLIFSFTIYICNYCVLN